MLFPVGLINFLEFWGKVTETGNDLRHKFKYVGVGVYRY